MNYTYEFATGRKEIEVDDKWGEILRDLDRQEANNFKQQIRRHERLDENDVQNVRMIDETKNQADEYEEKEAFSKIRALLTDKQMDAVIGVYYMGYTESEYAEMHGLVQSTVHERLSTAREKLSEKRIRKFF